MVHSILTPTISDLVENWSCQSVLFLQSISLSLNFLFLSLLYNLLLLWTKRGYSQSVINGFAWNLSRDQKRPWKFREKIVIQIKNINLQNIYSHVFSLKNKLFGQNTKSFLLCEKIKANFTRFSKKFWRQNRHCVHPLIKLHSLNKD